MKLQFLLRTSLLKVAVAAGVFIYFSILPVHADSNSTHAVEQRQPHRLEFDDYLQKILTQQNQWFDQYFSDRFFQSSRDYSEDIDEIHKRILDALKHSPSLSPAVRHVGQNLN